MKYLNPERCEAGVEITQNLRQKSREMAVREIIKTGAVGFAQTIRPRSALASDRKSIKIH